MEFLKDLFGTEALTYEQLGEKLKTAGKDGKEAKLADLSQGGYVSLEKHNAVISDRDGLKTQLDAAGEAMKAFDGVDPADMKAKVEEAQRALTEAQATHAAELAKLTSRSETERMLSGQKFINDITRTHYVNAVETALDAPENKGKSREDIFKALTHDAEGKPNPGIFLEENPNRLQGPPPAGGGAPQEVTKEQFKAMDYKQMLDLANSNPQLYESLNKED